MVADQMPGTRHLDMGVRVSGAEQAARRAARHHTVRRPTEDPGGSWSLYNIAWAAFKRCRLDWKPTGMETLSLWRLWLDASSSVCREDWIKKIRMVCRAL